MAFVIRIEVTVYNNSTEDMDEVFHNTFRIRSDSRDTAVLYGERMMQHSRAQTVDCLGCGKAINYRLGTCPHCGRKEF